MFYIEKISTKYEVFILLSYHVKYFDVQPTLRLQTTVATGFRMPESRLL